MAQSRGQGPGRPRNNQPWNVLYPREYQVAGSHQGSNETRTDFMRIGVAFPLQNRQGFSITLFLQPPVVDGLSRLVLMPRDDAEGDGR